jgi:PAS domain S-box-containing protein
MSINDPRTSQNWADMAEELAGVGYWWMDAAAQTIRWSPNMYRIFGIPDGMIPSLDYAMTFVHPEDRAAADQNLESNLSGRSTPSVVRIVRPSGEVRHIEGRNACEFGPAGEVVAVYGTVLDLTDRLEAEHALAESEKRYRLLAENSADVTFCFQPDGTITFVTPGVRNLLGFEPRDLVGKSTFDIMDVQDHDRVRKTFADYVLRGPDAEPIKIEFRASTRDGRELWLESHPRTLFDAGGRLVEVQDVVRDVTYAKEVKRHLQVAKEAAEVAATVKDEFLANISHELRTPLTAIIGYSGLLAEQATLPAAARGYSGQIEGASRALLSLVNGILDLSRIEAGRVTINRKASSAASIARECLDLLDLQALAKGLRLEYLEAGRIPASLLIDPDAYRQILINLLGNAVKFTQRGHVRLTIGYDRDRGELDVSVEDTGPGIRDDQADKLFHRFSQVDNSSARLHGGVGLGLAICKGLIDAMGGRIAAVGRTGGGAQFSFWLPAEAVADVFPQHHRVAFSAAGSRVLVVDDNPAIRSMTSEILRTAEVQVHEAADGAAALRVCAERPFDVILLDLSLPDMTGLDVVSAIRSRRGPNINAAIVAFTASATRAPSFYENAGFDDVLTKPVVPAELISLVGRLAGAWAAEGAA